MRINLVDHRGSQEDRCSLVHPTKICLHPPEIYIVIYLCAYVSVWNKQIPNANPHPHEKENDTPIEKNYTYQQHLWNEVIWDIAFSASKERRNDEMRTHNLNKAHCYEETISHINHKPIIFTTMFRVMNLQNWVYKWDDYCNSYTTCKIQPNAFQKILKFWILNKLHLRVIKCLIVRDGL